MASFMHHTANSLVNLDRLPDIARRMLSLAGAQKDIYK